MKKLILILLFSTVMFSSPSYAEWTKIVQTMRNGNTFYVDYERIRKHDGYVYFWYMNDFGTNSTTGDLSGKIYAQGDCKLFRVKVLSRSIHKEPMGGGTGILDNVPDKEWTYPPPDFFIATVLKQVCNR